MLNAYMKEVTEVWSLKLSKSL